MGGSLHEKRVLRGSWDIFRLGRLREDILSIDLESLAPVAVVLLEACLLIRMMVCIFVLFLTSLFSCYPVFFVSWCLEKVLVLSISVWLGFWNVRT